MELGEYILRAARQPWDWGAADCCTFMAGWVIERGHPDPMAFIRGQYDSELSALRRIREGGGLVPLWTRGMGEAGVPEADDVRAGDVGIIEATTLEGFDQACGIYSGERWVSLGLRGIEAGPADCLIVWRP